LDFYKTYKVTNFKFVGFGILHIHLYNTQQINYNRIEKKAISNLYKVSLLDFVHGLY
jgi:hypothetical protein